MKSSNSFAAEILEVIKKEKIIGIRAGRDSSHKVIGIWAVVVERSVFVRSYSMKPLVHSPVNLNQLGAGKELMSDETA